MFQAPMILAGLAALGAPPPASAPSALPDAETLMEWHIAAVGGLAALARHRTLVTRGIVQTSLPPGEGSFEIRAQAPGDRHARAALPVRGALEWGCVSGSCFEVRPGQRGLDPREERVWELRGEADFLGALRFPAQFSSLHTVGVRRFAGRDAYQVLAISPFTAPESWYFDVKTGLRFGHVTRPTGESARSELHTDWCVVDDVLVPSRLEIEDRARTVLITQSVELDGEVELSPGVRSRRQGLPRVLAGFVERAGEPVPEAIVQLSGPWVKASRTDASGRFRFDDVRDSKYELHVSSERGSGWGGGRFPPGALAVDEALVVLRPTEMLTGRVLGRGQAPVLGAYVHVSASAVGASAGWTDDRGRFRLQAPGGSLPRVIVRADGYLRYERELESPTSRATVVEVKLTPSVPAQGRASYPDGRPAARVALSAESESAGCFGRRVRESTLTDGAGRFVFHMLSSGRFHLGVDGLGEPRPRVIQLPATDLQIEVSGDASLIGRVHTALGEGAAFASLTLRAEDGTTHHERSAMANQDGEFRIEHVPEGEYLLDAGWLLDNRGTGRRRLSLRSGQVLAADIEIGGRYAISGIVKDAQGRPIPGAEVTASSATAYLEVEAGRDGRFRLDALRDEVHELRMTGIPGRPLRVRPGLEPVELVAEPVIWLRGNVRAEDGRPVPAFKLGETSVSDAAGRFDVPWPPSSRSVTLSAPGFARSRILLDERAGAGEIDLGQRTLGTGRVLRGRIIRSTTREPIAGAEVCHADPVSAARGALSWSGKDGQFELRHLERDPVDLQIVPANLPATRVTVDSDVQDLIVAVDDGASVVVRGFDESGRLTRLSSPLLRSRDGWESRYASWASEGEYRFSGIRGGAYLLSVMRPEEDSMGLAVYGPRSIWVPRDATARVELYREADPASIRVRHVDSLGKPVRALTRIVLDESTSSAVPTSYEELAEAGVPCGNKHVPDVSCQVVGLPPGCYQLWVRPWDVGGSGVHVDSVELLPGEERVLELRLPDRLLPILPRGALLRFQ